MSWRDVVPLSMPMRRVAIVAPAGRAVAVLATVADAGVFEPDHLDGAEDDPMATPEQRLLSARHIGPCSTLTGWMPAEQIEPLRARVEPLGGGVAEIPMRRGLLTPTLHAESMIGTALRPLVTTYGTIPYRDVDPTFFAALSYMLMFGMMFGDVAHGLALALFGLAVGRATSGRLAALSGFASFLVGAGVAAAGFGLLYGEAFGPTGLVPTLWLHPLEEPQTLLVAGLVAGTCLLAITFVYSTVNRWRESGPAVALYDASGLGGTLLFVGLVSALATALGGPTWLSSMAMVAGGAGLVLVAVGLVAQTGVGPTGWAQAIIEMFDTVLRLGSAVVSFTRLAAFGLTHAVITSVVWDGTAALWGRGGVVSIVEAAALFVVGNIAAFALGALVGAIQALRLEYYELFSRLFLLQGRPFVPWHRPLEQLESS